jgi:hypothetical protein
MEPRQTGSSGGLEPMRQTRLRKRLLPAANRTLSSQVIAIGSACKQKTTDGCSPGERTPGSVALCPAIAGPGSTGLDRPDALGRHPWTAPIGR